MQILAGTYRGHKLTSTPSRDIRPCSSRVKKSLFDTLAVRIDFEGIAVLDLFAGFGNMGFEALSRGAGFVSFVDRNPQALTSMQVTASRFGVSDDVAIVRSDVTVFLDRTEEPFDLVFCDPPYSWPDYDRLIERIAGNGMLVDEGLLLVEHQADLDFHDSPYYLMHKDYGMTRVTFFQHHEGSS
ncbi:MAG: 16S rRNA (guanine(966)-N(2))-methyltransferase RsmD [Chlorobium sp.]|uniref:16S rRNA (guanine(966)-N(2))-methyltransferase RsmD n=1 Tax=Chlorobium sp. TaxID=1095 RepID=UPI0025BA6BAC|nr:16S rRNA (guanine(966)-N(2))-methyltransferase RsmD [Chlorobium sp.]MCF8382377.1 16S rRNA (guanine(966)-N(2))-methyltransferase RsmD [Chlorobium sp.]